MQRHQGSDPQDEPFEQMRHVGQLAHLVGRMQWCHPMLHHLLALL
jgi:hypothetical protein